MAVRPPHNGFTLIELVCVITVLGILAATAMPRFTDLAKEARIAKVNAIAGAVHAAAQLGNAICLLDKSTNCLTTTDMNNPATVTRNGLTVSFIQGYPTAGNGFNNGGIDVLLNTSGFTPVIPAAGKTSFLVPDAPNPGTCGIGYCINSRAATAGNCGPDTGSYRVLILTTGC